jgi:hypothetical protein
MMRAACAGLVLLLAPSVGVAAVVYEEIGNQNDLPIDPPYPLIQLAEGTNSVLGRTSFSGDAVDSFAFSVPPGFQVESIAYVFTTASVTRGGASLTQAVSGFSFVTGDGSAPQPGSLLSGENVDMVPGLCSPFAGPCGPSSPSAVTVPLFEDALPRRAGVYSVEQRALTVNDPELVTWSSNYSIDLEVVVPEPAGALLAAAGLVVLAGTARSKTRG